MAGSRWVRRVNVLGVALLVVFLLLQLKQVERTNPAVVSELQAPPEIASILEQACYDCHSHRTEWPWYAHVAPISWKLVEHVEHGRGDLNFSDWPSFDMAAEQHLFRDIDEQIAKDEMPPKNYRWLHPEARLSDADRQALRDWAQAQF